MMDEETLAGLLAEHAERIPLPPSAVDALLAASPRAESSTMRRFTYPPVRVLAAAAVVVLVAGVVWAAGAHSGTGSPVVRASAAADSTSPTTDAGPAGVAAGGVGTGALPSVRGGVGLSAQPYQSGSAKSVAQGSGSASDDRSDSTGTAGTTSAAVAPTDTARVVRTGTLDLKIKRHAFGATIGRITTIAAAAGGYIADAQTFESAATPSGTVTVRVPSARFNATVEQLRTLGTVVSATTSGVDVTGQYTDLRARLTAATATRDQYLTVLAKATNIGDILAVQDRIQSVQTQIDQLSGQIQELDTQTTYGKITVSVAEPGPKAKPIVRPHHPSGLSVAWANARNGFARRVEGIISHSGSALVVLVGLLLLAGALRLLVPRMRRLLV